MGDRLRVAVVLLAATLLGCTETKEPGIRQIGATPPTLLLLADKTGQPTRSTITAESVGSGGLLITRAEITGGRLGAFRAELRTPVKMSAGGTVEIRVEYWPGPVGTSDNAALVIESDATNMPVLAIPLVGRWPDEDGGVSDGGVSDDGGIADEDAGEPDAQVPDLGPCTGAFSAPEWVNEGAMNDAANEDEVDIAADERGHVIAVWRSTDIRGDDDTDIFYAHSMNHGLDWSAKRELNNNAVGDGVGDYRPRIATDGNGTWIVVWHSANPDDSGRGDFDIFAVTSTSDGQTWSRPDAINPGSNLDIEDDQGVDIATDRKGLWMITWWTSQDAILATRSINNGANWSLPEEVTESAYADYDSPPDLGTDGAGSWIVGWHSHEFDDIQNEGDVVFSRTTATASITTSWNEPVPLNIDYPMERRRDEEVQFATDERGNWVAVWAIYNEGEIYSARSDDHGKTWESPVLVAENEDRFFGDPVVATDHHGTWYALWATTRAFDLDLYTSVSTNAVNWSEATLLRPDAPNDSALNNPRILFDHQGNGLAAWTSSISPQGVAHADGDLLRSVFNCR